MPYDFTRVESALYKCAEKRDWQDRASQRLEREYLIPLERHTASLSALTNDIERFMQSAEREFEEIMMY